MTRMSKILSESETTLETVSRTRKAVDGIWRAEHDMSLQFAPSEILKTLDMAISAGGILYYWRYHDEGHTPDFEDQVYADFILYLSKMLELEDQIPAP